MKEIRTVNAVGHVLCHDITQIIKDVTKGPVFRKGHVIREEDIPVLLSVGKDHIYVWENDETMMHEDEAAEVLASLCMGKNVTRGEAKEGKIELRAACDGVLKIDEAALEAVNSFGQMMIATRHGNFPVRAGDKLAGTRIIPLVIEKEKMEAVRAKAEAALARAASEAVTDGAAGASSDGAAACLDGAAGACSNGAAACLDGAAEDAGRPAILNVLPLQKRRVGIVTTGNEVFHGRIEDTFTPVVAAKVTEFGAEIVGHEYSDDDNDHIEAAIRKLLEDGADMILCTGGMSVDPDDRTPAAIRNVCGQVVTYGAPVLPGAMFLLAYYEGGAARENAAASGEKSAEAAGATDKHEGGAGENNAAAAPVPVMGLPGCVMYARRTIFDLVLPRVIAGEILTKADFDRLGQGGLCLDCEVCTYPNCGFGK